MVSIVRDESGHEKLEDSNTSVGLKGVYEGVKFPKYKFEDYPKYVTTPNGRVVVESEAEELRLRSDGSVMDAPVKNPFAEENKKLEEQVKSLEQQVKSALAQLQKVQGKGNGEGKSEGKNEVKSEGKPEVKSDVK